MTRPWRAPRPSSASTPAPTSPPATWPRPHRPRRRYTLGNLADIDMEKYFRRNKKIFAVPRPPCGCPPTPTTCPRRPPRTDWASSSRQLRPALTFLSPSMVSVLINNCFAFPTLAAYSLTLHNTFTWLRVLECIFRFKRNAIFR